MMSESDRLYEQYLSMKRYEEKIQEKNIGLNLLGKTQEKRKPYIHIHKIFSVNLRNATEEIVVETNIDIDSYSWRGHTFESFLKGLKEQVSKPYYKPISTFNRKSENKKSSYDKPKFRKEVINFEDIEFVISDKTKEEVGKYGFVEKVKQILENQKFPTAEEEKGIERFIVLLEKKEDYKRQFKKQSSYSYYSYGQSEDKTPKLSTLSVEEYNSKLQKVKDEMEEIGKICPYLKIPTFYFEEVEEKKEEVTFDEWKEENENEIRESWDFFDDDEREEYESFENYLQEMYEQIY